MVVPLLCGHPLGTKKKPGRIRGVAAGEGLILYIFFFIHKNSVLTAFRRPKNLKDHLVRAKLSSVKHTPDQPINQCLRPNTSRYCPKLNTDGRILCSASGRMCMSRFNVNCSSSNLIYCITCKRCGIQYVGQTKRELKMRLSEHFLKITRNDPDSEIAGHFKSAFHEGLDNISVYVVDFVHAAPHTQKSKYLRDLLEFNWIQRLHKQNKCPSGLKCYGSPEILTQPMPDSLLLNLATSNIFCFNLQRRESPSNF